MKYINAKNPLLLSFSTAITLLVGCGGEVSFDPSNGSQREPVIANNDGQASASEIIVEATPPAVSQPEGIDALHAGCVTFDKNSLNFGNVASGAFYSETVTLSNICSVDASVLELNIVSDNSTRFTFEGPKKAFVLPAHRSITLEVGLNAYLGVSGTLVTNPRIVDPIILQNNYAGNFEVVFADAEPQSWPIEVYSSSISLVGRADINTVDPNVPTDLDPRLQQELRWGDQPGREPAMLRDRHLR
ncbi:MAG: hypothetical protein VYC39_02610 [Myxococcota bacterium]|nr:hypothetical protein [Myxococcota bacterium]